MNAPAAMPRWIEYHPVDDIVPADRNPKAHDKEFLADSVRRHGFVEPVLNDGRTGKLIAGHGRLETLADAQALGIDPPDGILVADDGRWKLPVVYGWSSRDDAEARAYLLVANRAPERGGWESGDLAAMLHDMHEAAEDLLTAGWTDDEYRELLSETGLLSELEGAFLDDVAGDAGTKPPGKDSVRNLSRGTDVVDLRLPMSPAERDEAVALLRAAQRSLGVATLSGTLLALLRAHSDQ